MHRILLILSYVLFVVGTNGASLKLTTSINKNAIELTQLWEKFWSLKPAVVLNQQPLAICSFIENCCEGEDRSKAIPLIFSSTQDSSAEIINTCTHSATVNKADQSCPSVEQFDSLPTLTQEEPAVKQFFNVTNKYNGDLIKILDYIGQSCNDYEYHALICSLDKKLMQSCAAKVLQDIYDDYGHQAYYEVMKKIKQTFTDLNQELAQLTVENINTD